jgi:hypothetical protein
MNVEQHFRGLQYLHRTLAIGTVTGLVSVYARLMSSSPLNDLHKYSGLSLYCSLLCIIRIKFYLDDEDHFQERVKTAEKEPPVRPKFEDLVDAFFSCLSWIAFLAAVALLQFASPSRDAISAAMFSSLLWVFDATLRDKKNKDLGFHTTIAIANIIYMFLFTLMNHANPSWFGQHAEDLRGYLQQEKWTILAFFVCVFDWALTYRNMPEEAKSLPTDGPATAAPAAVTIPKSQDLTNNPLGSGNSVVPAEKPVPKTG